MSDESFRITVFLVAAAAALWVLSTAACGPVGGCPEPETHRIDADRYVQTSVAVSRVGGPQGQPEDAEVRVDREAGVVELIYQKDGQKVVETWGIADSEL